jgi:hypothetical protein
MISLLNFIDTGFIITLGLLLLISGAVMLYCYRRLNMLENSVIEHGKILQNFIMNFNNQFFAGQQNQNQNQAQGLDNSEMDDESSDGLVMINQTHKISVSDDGDANSDADEDDNEYDSGSDDSDEDDDYDEDDADADADADSGADEGVDEGVKSKTVNLIENIEIKDNLFDGIKLMKETTMDDINNPFLSNLPVDLQDLDITLPELVDTPVPENTSENTTEKKNYSRQKVDELRTLVVAKNLTDNESAQQMKKTDLLKLLH